MAVLYDDKEKNRVKALNSDSFKRVFRFEDLLVLEQILPNCHVTPYP